MASLIRTLLPLTSLLLLTSAPLTNAHFTVTLPPPIGPFDEDIEPTAPCGGFTVDFSKDNITDFHVGGQDIAVFLAHTQAGFLFRGTLDQTAMSNWSMLYPIIEQTGLGNYCQKGVTAPESWVGMKGVIGVVADAPDGLLYQCATVNFVSGVGATTSTCANSTGVTAAFVTDSSLAALVGSNSTTNATTTSSSTSTMTSATATSTSSKSAAPGMAAPVQGGLAMAAVTALVMGFVGAATML